MKIKQTKRVHVMIQGGAIPTLTEKRIGEINEIVDKLHELATKQKKMYDLNAFQWANGAGKGTNLLYSYHINLNKWTSFGRKKTNKMLDEELAKVLPVVEKE